MASSDTGGLEAELTTLTLERPDPGALLRDNPDTTLPAYAQLINCVAGMVLGNELLDALNLADYTARLYPTDFTRASTAILRAQIYAKQSKWELSRCELAEARMVAELVREAGRADHVAQMGELDICANELQSVIASQLDPGGAEEVSGEKVEKKEKKRRKKRGSMKKR